MDIIALAKRQRRRIILPESHDERIVEAARIIRDEGIADVLLIGDKSGSELEREFSENLIDPSGYQNLSELVNVFLGSQKSRDMTECQAVTYSFLDQQQLQSTELIFGCKVYSKGLLKVSFSVFEIQSDEITFVVLILKRPKLVAP